MQMNQCNYLSFIAPLPTSPVDVQTAEPTLGDISIVSQSVTNNRCAPSCGGHKGKVGGHIEKFSAGASRRHYAPPLANCFRRHWRKLHHILAQSVYMQT